MTVGELKKALGTFPEDKLVMVYRVHEQDWVEVGKAVDLKVFKKADRSQHEEVIALARIEPDKLVPWLPHP